MPLFGSQKLQITIPKPCQENWDQMEGTDRERFCQACQSSVLDFSSLTRTAAIRLLESTKGPVCGRIVHDKRGNMAFRPEASKGHLARIAGLSLAGVAGLAAQSTCELQVNVKDPTGAVVEGGAKVSAQVRQGDRITARESTTKGIYTAKLQPGRYEVDVTTPDFQRFRAQDVEVSCRDNQSTIVKAELREAITVGLMVLVRPEPSRLSGTLDLKK